MAPTTRDVLSTTTRRERRYLLLTSGFGVMVKETGLVPSRIAPLGIEFTEANQVAVIDILTVVVTYLLLAFVVYVLSDCSRFVRRFRLEPIPAADVVRAAFEFVAPVFIGILAIGG